MVFDPSDLHSSVTSSFLCGRCCTILVFGSQRSLGSHRKPVCIFAWSPTHLGENAVVWNRLPVPTNLKRCLSESYIVCITHSNVVRWQLCVVPLVCSLDCKRPDCLRKNWSWTASALVPNSTTRILVLCPLSLLYFCSIPKCRVAGGDNAAWLILCLCTLLLCLCTQIVCVAWERGWMFGSCCLMIKGVMLLIEVSCTEICAYTLCNMCTVIFQAVLGLLHICCKNSLTTCSKPKCAKMICVCTRATCLGFLGAHMVKNLHPPSRQTVLKEGWNGWGHPGARQPYLGGTYCWYQLGGGMVLFLEISAC